MKNVSMKSVQKMCVKFLRDNADLIERRDIQGENVIVGVCLFTEEGPIIMVPEPFMKTAQKEVDNHGVQVDGYSLVS